MSTASNWPEILTGLVQGTDLTQQQASWAMTEILSGNASPAQMAGFVVALRAKGESVEELAGMADVMLALATPVAIDTEAVDVVGTGGDRKNTVNISTMAAVVAAAAGARVVKHGNRAASSACGTADVLEHLGVALDVAPAAQQAVLEEAGIAFLFAPLYHSSLRHAAATRRELGISTTFNFLGPLANPARPTAQAVGVADVRMAGLVAGVLAMRGARGLVFHGDDGLDELTTTTSSQVWMIGEERSVAEEFDPRRVGLDRAAVDDLVGGPPPHNAEIFRRMLGGETGPVRDVVLLNAAAALMAYRGPDLGQPVEEQVARHLEEVARAVDTGAAKATLERWIAACQAAERH